MAEQSDKTGGMFVVLPNENGQGKQGPGLVDLRWMHGNARGLLRCGGLVLDCGDQ